MGHTIIALDFGDAEELVRQLLDLIAFANVLTANPEIRVSSRAGFCYDGRAVLLERMQNDGSRAFDIEIRDKT